MEVDLDTGKPQDALTETAVKFCKTFGSEAKAVSEILSTKDEKIMKAIQEGIDRANKNAISRAQKVRRRQAILTALGREEGREGGGEGGGRGSRPRDPYLYLGGFLREEFFIT